MMKSVEKWVVGGVVVVAGFLLTLSTFSGCGGEKAEKITPHETLATSLHGTTGGMRYWYSDTNGMVSLTGIPYDDLACKNCHTKGCEDCHDVDANGEPQLGGKEKDPATCYACHGRQKMMAMKIMPMKGEKDVHMAKGMVCADCHTSREIHGDGKEWNTLLDPGFFDVKCENCHKDIPDNSEHNMHAGKQLECSACHVKRVMACYNCHFNAEIKYDKKVPYGPLTDFVFLVKNSEGKVTTGTIMALDYLTDVTDPATTKTLVAIAPYYAHTITSAGRTCSDCHNNEAVQEYKNKGKITFTWWDDAESKIKNKTGVIPYVEGKMEFQFVRPLTPDAEPNCTEAGCSYPEWVTVTGVTPTEQKIGKGVDIDKLK